MDDEEFKSKVLEFIQESRTAEKKAQAFQEEVRDFMSDMRNFKDSALSMLQARGTEIKAVREDLSDAKDDIVKLQR